MSGRSAFDALIAEVVGLDEAITQARLEEAEARDAFVEARQRFDKRQIVTNELVARCTTTEQALRLIKARDGISDEVVLTLLERPLDETGA